MCCFICSRTYVWANSRNAGGLGHNRAHHDVTVMVALTFHGMDCIWTNMDHTIIRRLFGNCHVSELSWTTFDSTAQCLLYVTLLVVVYVIIWFIQIWGDYVRKLKDQFRSHVKLIPLHYSDVIMNAMASQYTGVSIVYSTVCSGANQRKPQSPASLDFVWGIHRWPVNYPYKLLVTRKMFPFDDVIMMCSFDKKLCFVPPWDSLKSHALFIMMTLSGVYKLQLFIFRYDIVVGKIP